MAEEGSGDQGGIRESSNPQDEKKESRPEKTKRKGLLSRIWNGLFRMHGDDFEKRLQHISKEEAAILARLKKRSQDWRKMATHLIIFSLILEVVAVGYAIMMTRSLDLNWKMRAFRVSPMFILPALSFVAYTAIKNFSRMRDRKDQKTLERLRAERQAKIDELKEKTNYYITQQLIQRYDPDPAAKAAAATVLASKLGADSGLKVHVGGETKSNVSRGISSDMELMESSGLRNRKQLKVRSSGPGSTVLHYPNEEMATTGGPGGPGSPEKSQPLVVEHHQDREPSIRDGGWFARIAALLVGEDPKHSFALICGNCHMHNGLVKEEDFPYVTYYCPHCHALNRSKQVEEHVSASSTYNVASTPVNSSDDGISTGSPPSEAVLASAVTVQAATLGSEIKAATGIGNEVTASGNSVG